MAYTDAITALERKLFSFDPEAEQIYNLINGLKAYIPVDKKEDKPTNTVKILKFVFDKNDGVKEQILFALKYSGRVSKSPEIVNTIREFDPSFDKGMSTPLRILREEGIIDVYNPTITIDNTTGSNHHVYYGLKEWFNGENDVKEDYIGVADLM
jgi:hypothetical protein